MRRPAVRPNRPPGLGKMPPPSDSITPGVPAGPAARGDADGSPGGAGARSAPAAGSEQRLPADPVLVREQVLFALDPAAIAGQAAVGAHHPVAGHDDADGVLPVGQADGPRCRGLPDPAGKLAVGDSLAVRNVLQGRPDTPLERGAFQGETEIEPGPLPVEVLLQLPGHLSEQLTVLIRPRLAERPVRRPVLLLVHVQAS